MKLLRDDEHLGAARTSTALTARSRRTRAALVDGVREELRVTGTFTAENVADRAECSTASFYGHFATKDDALTAAFELVLIEMFQLLEETITIDRVDADPFGTVEDFVQRQAAFFRAESLLFRTALSRLSSHKALRYLYREAERVSLEHLALVLGDKSLAERFLVISQGLNNPRALRPNGKHIRTEFARSLTDMIVRDTTP